MDCRYEWAAAVLAVGCYSFFFMSLRIYIYPRRQFWNECEISRCQGGQGVSVPGLGDLESLQPRLQVGFVSKWVTRGLRKLRGGSPILDLIGG